MTGSFHPVGPDEPTDSVDRAMVLSRDGWGRIIALIASADGDLAGAEDALSAALERGVRAWRDSGVPDNPEGWLYRVALNVRRDAWKSAAARTSTALDASELDASKPDGEVHDGESAGGRLGADPANWDPDVLPDRRLELLAVCAHPDIDPGARPLLMLSAVMGMTGRQIASAMALPAATVAARLTRAKKKVAALGVGFGAPDRVELEARLPDVHEAIYGAFASEWAHAAAEPREGMIGEALYLARLLTRLCPGDGESHGLAALVDLSAARFPARRGGSGEFVPLPDQDPESWDSALIAAGEDHLREAHRCAGVGRFGLEAGIQILHMAGVRRGETDWPMLLRLHDHLDRIAPSLGGAVSRAAVIAEIDGPEAGLAALDAVTAGDGRTSAFQPAWALRGHLLSRLGQPEESAAAYRRAIDLTTDPGERAYLLPKTTPTSL